MSRANPGQRKDTCVIEHTSPPATTYQETSGRYRKTGDARERFEELTVRHVSARALLALEIATGKVTDACYPRHRRQVFLRFLQKVPAAYPGTDLHVLCDNYATHKHAAGVHKEVLVRRSSRQQAPVPLFDEDEFQYTELSSDGKGQRMIGNLRIGPADRVRLVIQALRRLMVELPEIHEDAIKRLASADDADAAAADMRFLPDEDDTAEAPPGLDTVMASRSRAAREAAVAFLARLDQEVSQA